MYAAAGFESIGLWEFRTPRRRRSQSRAVARARLGVANCVPSIPSITQLGIPGLEGPADHELRIEALCSSVRRLAAYEPECVLCLTGPLGDHTPAEARSIVIDGLQRVAAAAAEAGVRLGLEPIHPMDRSTTSWVNTVAAAGRAPGRRGARRGRNHGRHLQPVGRRSRRTLARGELRACQRDARRGSSRSCSGRTLPGEAGAREKELVDALRSGGWQGSLDVEIFSTPEDFWSLPVDEAARRAHAAASTLL